MKKSNSLKAIALSLGLAALMAPATLDAQINHGLLQNPYKTETNKAHRSSLQRDGNSSTLNGSLVGTQQEDPTSAPLGSGIAFLVAAGAGYALLKRKEEAK
jgi:hypothetical protein